MATAAPPRGSPFVNLSRLALRSIGRLRLAALALATALPAAGLASCNILDDDQELPNTARVEITGSSPEPLELVVSDNFERVANIDQGARYTVLVQSDTSFVQPDFAMDYDIEGIHTGFTSN